MVMHLIEDKKKPESCKNLQKMKKMKQIKSQNKFIYPFKQISPGSFYVTYACPKNVSEQNVFHVL